MGAISQDTKFGLRTLKQNPAFTAMAVMTLALGIGANTAIFSVMDAVLLRPFSYPDSGRLVAIMSQSSTMLWLHVNGRDKARCDIACTRERSTSQRTRAGLR
jgi:hypothetical protein